MPELNDPKSPTLKIKTPTFSPEVKTELDLLDTNDLSYWFPLLKETNLKVPKTILIDSRRDDLLRVIAPEETIDNELRTDWENLLTQIRGAGEVIGWPIFLRTGQGSGKHSWKETCYLTGPEQVASHVANLIEWSELVSFFGLSTRFWAVREFLPLRSHFQAFEGMPVAREFRLFVRAGKVECFHPYWPPDTILHPTLPDAEWREILETQNQSSTEEREMIINLVEQALVNNPLGEDYWSLDLAQLALTAGQGDGKDSWVATDMAGGERSYHWADCPLANPGTPG